LKYLSRRGKTWVQTSINKKLSKQALMYRHKKKP
jgi:hypothetical protein